MKIKHHENRHAHRKEEEGEVVVKDVAEKKELKDVEKQSVELSVEDIVEKKELKKDADNKLNL